MTLTHAELKCTNGMLRVWKTHPETKENSGGVICYYMVTDQNNKTDGYRPFFRCERSHLGEPEPSLSFERLLDELEGVDDWGDDDWDQLRDLFAQVAGR